MVIDNFALTMHQACPAKYDLRIRNRWTSRRKSGALNFGAVLHEGLASYYRNGATKHALPGALMAIKENWKEDQPAEDFRTLEKCLRTMMEYAEHYGSENFTVLGAPENPLIENHFTLDTELYLPLCWHETVDPATGLVTGTTGCGHLHPMSEPIRYQNCSICSLPLEPLEYGGIFDGVVSFAGRYFILEHKTTTQFGSYYFDQYNPNNQVTGYIWAARKLSGQPVGGAIINAIGIYKASATKFGRQITTRTEAQISEWLKNVWYEASEIQINQKNNYWPMRTGSCTMYGKCEFHPVHSLANPLERSRFLEQEFIQQEWDFIRRDEPGATANG